MTLELKKFFEKIKNSEDSFLFLRLYHNPSSVLGSKQDMDEAEEEYYTLHNYFDLMLNNNLTEFIDLVLRDEEFGEKANIQIWRKFNFFICDSINFIRYHHFKYDEDLMRVLKNEITIKEFLDKKQFSNIDEAIMEIIIKSDIYLKYIKLFEYDYSKEQIESYDVRKSLNVRNRINLRMLDIKERTIDRQRSKEVALEWILEDDYSEKSDYDNMYLYRHVLKNDFYDPQNSIPGICATSFYDLVCENRFLDVMEQILKQGMIEGIPLDNAIEIINMGIQIKECQEPDAEFLAKTLGVDLVKEFDIKKAKNLLSQLFLYKRKKEKNPNKLRIIK